jgi:hypothetical protein
MPSQKPEDETILQSLCPKRELRKGCYCTKRTRIRTSKIMIRAAITTLPSWNALRRSYLKLLLFLLRPMVLFLCSLAVGGAFRRPPSISMQEGVWG